MLGALVTAAAAAALAAPAPAPAATGLLAVGDFGVGGKNERRLGRKMRNFEADHPAAALVTLGDNDYTESPPAFRRNWRDSFGWLSGAGVGVAGTLGNHDVRVQRGRYQFEDLDMPRARYQRVIGNVHLFVLNSNRARSAGQTAWLERRLAASTARWQVVSLHHPPYTCGVYRSHPDVVANWVPLFERYDVDLVLAGHDHNYQRFAPHRGVRYVVHGGAASTRPLARCPAGYPRRVAASERRGFLYLVAGDDRLRGRAVTRRGRVIDRFTLYP